VEEQPINARFAGDDSVMVTVLDPPVQGDVEAAVVNVSHTCLRLHLGVRIPRDAYLLVKLKDFLLFGEVGSCSPSSGAFEISVLVEESLCLGSLEPHPVTLMEIVGAAPELERDLKALREIHSPVAPIPDLLRPVS
jgi:hypothetical protein